MIIIIIICLQIGKALPGKMNHIYDHFIAVECEKSSYLVQTVYNG